MFIVLSNVITVSVSYVIRRNSVFYFQLRVPADLISRYGGKELIRQSLKTGNEREAIKKAQALYQTCQAQFKALRGNESLTPAESLKAAQAFADKFGSLESFVDHHAEPKLHAYYQRHGLDNPDDWDRVENKDVLNPVELKALEILQRGPGVIRLSHALESHRNTHPKGNDENFMLKEGREWQKLITLVGDIPIEDLTRDHARSFINHLLAKGNKTTTVRRSLNSINSIFNEAVRELGLKVANPFAKIRIPGADEDAKEIKVPSIQELAQIAAKFRGDTTATALIILIQIGTGARIGEISGLAVSDVVLNHETPHITIQPQPWRDTKTQTSIRNVPLVGIALEAAKTAVKLAGTSKGLFPQYAKERGNDSASAACNKRLSEWGITSHGFRHALKDLLRETGCTKDIRDAIQGHGKHDHGDYYGKGHTLKTMRDWLIKAESLITQNTPEKHHEHHE